MREIKVDNGLREVSLNGVVSVWLNLTDMNFIERLFNAFDGMDAIYEKYQARLEGVKDSADAFKITKQVDTEIRGIVDDVFSAEVCQPLFGGCNVCATSDGLPLWCNLMLAIIDEIDSTITSEQKRTNPRLKKYISKYSGKSGK